MPLHKSRKSEAVACAAVCIITFIQLVGSGAAQVAEPNNQTTDMTVLVKDYETNEPVSQARVTLQFGVPHGPMIPNRKPKYLTYNGKTDGQGRCKFIEVNKGPIIVSVNATGHQTYGQQLSLEKDNQVFEVRLKKPQPLR